MELRYVFALSSDVNTVNTVAKDDENISDFKDFPDMKLSMLSAPSFTDLFPTFFMPFPDTSRNVFFPTSVGKKTFL